MTGFISRWLSDIARRRFFHDLLQKTGNFSGLTWLGKPIWQNILDLWTIQETLYELRPQLLIECGAYRGGSAFFYAQLFDLLGQGQVLSIDLQKQHELSHPRISFVLGDSTAPAVVAQARQYAAAVTGPVMVILDSDHHAAHVLREIECYAPLVTPGSYCLVQDGVIDTLPMFRGGRPGPLVAIREFLKANPHFVVERSKSERFLISHHPDGWLRRTHVAATGAANES